MTWRNPRFYHLHAGNLAGAANITTIGTESTEFPKQNLIDYRMTVPFKWTDSSTAHYVQINATGLPYNQATHLYIPANHNLNGAHILCEDSNNPAFPAPTLLLAEYTVTEANDEPIFLEFTTSSVLRHIRVSFPTVAGAWEFNQLYVTDQVTLGRGPEPDWIDELRPNVLSFDNDDSVQLKVDQRHLVYSYRALGREAAADLLAMETLVSAVSAHKPFLLDTAYDAADGGETLFVKLRERAAARNDARVPQATLRRKRIALDMLEYLG